MCVMYQLLSIDLTVHLYRQLQIMTLLSAPLPTIGHIQMGGGSVMLDFGPGLIRHEATMGMTVPNGLMILSVNLGLVSRLHQPAVQV